MKKVMSISSFEILLFEDVYLVNTNHRDRMKEILSCLGLNRDFLFHDCLVVMFLLNWLSLEDPTDEEILHIRLKALEVSDELFKTYSKSLM